QRVHPQPHLRGGRQARGDGGLLQERQLRGQVPPGDLRRAERSIPASHDPAARLEVMNDLGIERTLMFPTLASLIEERMRDDPDLIHAVGHGLNQWLAEVWGFNYK